MSSGNDNQIDIDMEIGVLSAMRGIVSVEMHFVAVILLRIDIGRRAETAAINGLHVVDIFKQ